MNSSLFEDMARHGQAWWAERIEELSSGADVQTLARQYGVRPKTLVWWRSELARRARRAGAATRERPRLLPVTIMGSTRANTGVLTGKVDVEVSIEVGNARLIARGNLSPEHLSAMVASVRSC